MSRILNQKTTFLGKLNFNLSWLFLWNEISKGILETFGKNLEGEKPTSPLHWLKLYRKSMPTFVFVNRKEIIDLFLEFKEDRKIFICSMSNCGVSKNWRSKLDTDLFLILGYKIKYE